MNAEWATARRTARRKLLEICPYAWKRDAAIRYYAFVGSTARTLEEAGKEIFDLLDAAWLNARPTIPALNRWNKVYGPLIWWLFGVLFSGVIVIGFSQARRAATKKSFVLVDVEHIGPETEAGHRQRTRGRWNKAGSWIEHEDTPKAMIIGCVYFSMTLDLMSGLFAMSRSIVPEGLLRRYIASHSSIAEKVLVQIGNKMRMPQDISWCLLQPWTDESVHASANIGISLQGELFMRCIWVTIKYNLFKVGY